MSKLTILLVEQELETCAYTHTQMKAWPHGGLFSPSDPTQTFYPELQSTGQKGSHSLHPTWQKIRENRQVT